MNKKTIKGIIAMFVMVLTLGCVGITAEAASKTKKMTMYVGETFSYSYIGLGTVKSVSSSKKSVVTAKKKKKNSSIYSVMTAKKKGKAKVTVKGTSGTFIYDITVKAKPKLEVNITPRTDGYVNIEVKNNSKAFFDSVTVEVVFRDVNGTQVDSSKEYINYLGAKKSACEEAYVYGSNIDLSKTTYTISYDRNPDYTYKDYTKKVNFSTSESNGKLDIKTKISYKGKNSVYAAYTVYFYDAAGNITEAKDTYHFMSGDSKYRSYTRKSLK